MKASKPLRTGHLTLLALFTTMALAIYSIEAALPTLLPIPGVKPGLANIITLLVLRYLSAKDAFLVLLMRILIATFMFGQAMSLLYSLAGGIACLLVMFLINRLLQGHLLILTSIFGALAHNAGQLIVAMLLTSSTAVLSYIPFFVITSCLTGLFTGLCAAFSGKHLAGLLRRQRFQ